MTPKSNLPADLGQPQGSARKAALVLRALNHPLRQQILRLLDQSGGMYVTEMYVKLRLEQSICSQQLAILRRAGLVQTRREGKQIFYKLRSERIFRVVRLAEAMLED